VLELLDMIEDTTALWLLALWVWSDPHAPIETED
jgi:hypothetical protein